MILFPFPFFCPEKISRAFVRANQLFGLISFHPETPDEKLLVSDSESGDFLSWQENKGLRGGVHRYAAQVTLWIDTARAKKHPFRTGTS
jgi:hypothetical protein